MSAPVPGRAPVLVEGARVGVIGLARSGAAVARLLAGAGARVYASDVKGSDEARAAAAALAALGVEAEAGRHDEARLAACDWIVTSPGVPPTAPVLAAAEARGAAVYGELEVASWFARAPIAAITGTNGKTTTTALLGEIARAGGIAVEVAGNIGRAFSEAVGEARPDWWVLETSSFQLARIATFRPRIAVVLNLAPDHLDVYPTLEAYAADKRRIAENQTGADDLALNAEDPALAELFAGVGGARRHAFHRSAPVASGATVAGGTIRLVGGSDPGPVVAAAELGIPGAHNVQNALAAALAGALMGVRRGAIGAALRAFRGVPHRLETVLDEGGVRWVNDSKATNVASAAVALEAFDRPLVVILGGRHKGSSYAPLAGALRARGKRVLAIGEAAPLVAAELGGAAAVEEVGTLERAVERAAEIAEPGDVVLLAPACSSYDQFKDYEERGDRFRALAADAGREALR